MTTVIRFVVLYRQETESPHDIQSVILGVGFTQGGHSHSGLMDLYSPERKVHDALAGERVYAGYFHAENETEIVIYRDGGSSTLKIEKSESEDSAFIASVEANPKLKKAILEVYPLIATGMVANVELSVSQKCGGPLYG